MSFGIVAAVVGVTAIGAYSADQQRKAAHQQTDAINAAQAADAAQAAQAGANANAAIVSDKRRRRAAGGLLATTDPAAGVSVLGSAAGAPTSARAAPLKTTLGA